MIVRLLALLTLLLAAPSAAQPRRAEIEQAMQRATRFMVDEVAERGGYVWTWLPDRSRRWGEMEAGPGMIWVQAPGTATMGHLFLDAYHATRDDAYYRAAAAAADALIAGQHASGGWNYFIHFGGPEAARRWYETIGRNGWRLEEFQHYSDNATFDDAGTAEATQLLLRLFLERREPHFRAALDRAVGFILASQYPNGGWPQRFPHDPRFPSYSRHLTFNDDVATENVRVLVMVWQTLRDAELVEPIRRAMHAFRLTQLAPPQAGWALQHDEELRPAAARSYEPMALATHTTAANVRELLAFYRLTGDRRFLTGIPAALDWLESVRLPAERVRDGRAFPTFVELGSNRPITVHRRGSNVVNGAYHWDHDPAAPIAHYSQTRAIDLDQLRRDYAAAAALDPEAASRDSPLRATRPVPLPPTFIGNVAAGSDFSAAARLEPAEILRTLNSDGWWPTPLATTSNPYAGPGPRRPVPGDYRQSQVGDASDTSPYPDRNPAMGISTATYIANMARLIRALQERR